jgi:hypothetical protein
MGIAYPERFQEKLQPFPVRKRDNHRPGLIQKNRSGLV